MEFNIEDYLNSLPLDTTEINVSSKGLTYLPDLSRFKQLTKLDCSENELSELPPLNDNLTILDCSSNQLTELPHLNDNLTILHCSENQLTELPHLNDKLERLYCSSNQLTELPHLNDKLERLYCFQNKLTELPPLNNKLERLYCFHNQLTWLPPLNNKLQILDCSDNNIKNINNIIEILRNFRYTYYCLKFKKHFKRWLWEKVREPKIMAKFHPSHLNALEETDDLEVFLEDWIK
jgi:Leucine-rich repeat (LRR) protein